ncbi:hypothetical protein OA93_13910 [Flavobacterium sp. KMS]|uniref:hypothetical protein n=1 Tax=Flavobacterium sp. KMS TaxID=1566023 RepID=UPI00057C6D4E|nr:hypothetical protein [Flavobacterium sp. KMS]KIA97612.1 hypothetical protein OA93_13910 [Flavobacterium sp. KMS]
MELEKLQEKGINQKDFFIKKIDKKIEDLFVERYRNLSTNIKELTESFFIDLEIFKKLLKDNQSKKYCKFYYIHKDTYLNIGICFSDNDQCVIIEKEDKLFDLFGETIGDENFINMKNDFENIIGAKLSPHTNEIKDILTFYTLDNIKGYLEKMKDSHPSIYGLKFNMWQYCPTNIDPELAEEFTKRNNRISFCVHALFNKKNNLYSEGDAYDLGNLRP